MQKYSTWFINRYLKLTFKIMLMSKESNLITSTSENFTIYLEHRTGIKVILQILLAFNVKSRNEY